MACGYKLTGMIYSWSFILLRVRSLCLVREIEYVTYLPIFSIVNYIIGLYLNC